MQSCLYVSKLVRGKVHFLTQRQLRLLIEQRAVSARLDLKHPDCMYCGLLCSNCCTPVVVLQLSARIDADADAIQQNV